MDNRDERREILRLIHEVRAIAGSLYDTSNEEVLDHLSKNKYFMLFNLLDSIEEECKRHKVKSSTNSTSVSEFGGADALIEKCYEEAYPNNNGLPDISYMFE